MVYSSKLKRPWKQPDARVVARETRCLFLALITVPMMLSSCTREDSSPTPELPLKVEATVVKQQLVPRILTLTGNLRGSQETRLASNAMGRVTEVIFDRGATVTKGAVIARLDIRAATLAVAQAKAGLAGLSAQKTNADAECERSRRLLESGAITSQIYERTVAQCATSKAGVDAADAQAALAHLSVSDGAIRAPFAAVVIERFVNPGEYVMPGSPVVALADVDKMKLDISVPEQNLTEVQMGATVQFSVPAFPGQVFKGVINRIGSSVRQTSRDIVVEAEVPNTERLLLPGMFATVELMLGSSPTPVIPESAVFTRDERSRVFILADGRLEERLIQAGVKFGESIAVLRGVAVNELVVLNPSDRLHNGQKAN